MKIKTKIVTTEDFEVCITAEELGREIGKILSEYPYFIYDCEPELQVEEDCEQVRIEIYKSEIAWDGIMQTVFAKDIAKALKSFSEENK